MGIFDKACPQCMASNAAGRIRCACGYLFDSGDTMDEMTLTPELAAQEEELFEEYLGARVAQAVKAASRAARAAERAPDSYSKAAEVLRTQRAVEAANIELAAQRVKAAKAADAARAEAERKQTISRVAHVETPAAPAEDDSGATEAIRNSKLYQEYLAAPAAQAAKVAPQRKGPMADAVAFQRRTPGKALRAAQTAKAAQEMRADQSEATARCPWCDRTLSLHTERCPCGWSQATRPTTMVSPQEATLTLFDKSCPQCWAIVSLAAKQCACGHVFESSSPRESLPEPGRATREGSPPPDNLMKRVASANRQGGAKTRKRRPTHRAHLNVTKADMQSLPVRRQAHAYKHYLGARATEAVETARAAAEASARESEDRTKAQGAMRAQREAKAAKVAPPGQRRRFVRAAQARRGRATTLVTAWPSTIATEAAKAAKKMFGAAVRTATDVVGTAPSRKETEPMLPDEPVVTTGRYERAVSQAIEHAHAVQTRRRRSATVRTHPRARTTAKTRSQRRSSLRPAKINHSKSTGTVAASREVPPSRTADSGSEAKQNHHPDTAFRAAQAAKIARAVAVSRALEAVDRTRQAAEFDELKVGTECPVCTALLPADATNCDCGWLVPAGQRDLPTLVTAADDGARDEVGGLDCPMECPVCTGTIPAGAPHCACGWEVPQGEREMPSLTLSADERAALEQDIDTEKA